MLRLSCRTTIQVIEEDATDTARLASMLQPELKQRYFRAEYARLEGELVKELQEGATITPENLDDFFAAVLATAPPPSEHESP